MKGRTILAYEFPENGKIKSRTQCPEGVDFTQALRRSINKATLEILSRNAVTIRTEILANLKAEGIEVKKECYQKQIENDNFSMVRCLFSFPVKGEKQEANAEGTVSEEAVVEGTAPEEATAPNEPADDEFID